MDSTIIMLMIIIAMILLFAASNKENFIATIINSAQFENIKDKLNQVKVKLVEPNNNSRTTRNNGLITSQPIKTGPSNAVKLSIKPEQDNIVITPYNNDLDFESNANFGSQSTEINKFINDIKKQNCSGIMLSQRSSITNKNQFEINFYGSNIGIYIANVEYDTDKIQIGINIIDDIKKIMTVVEEEEGENHINDNEMEIINKEFNILSNQKLKHIKSIKEYAANLINEVNEMNLPTLHGILITMYGSNVSDQFICDKCGFVAKNNGSLAAHKKKTQRN